MSGSAWAVPTLATVEGVTGAARCPVCRRETTGAMLETHPGGTYWCDGCRERAFATGAITRHDYYAALGAPADVLAGL